MVEQTALFEGMEKITLVRPFLKWAGSKYQIIETLRGALPKGNRLIEPFVGSGAVFLNMSDKYDEFYLNDVSRDLIDIFGYLREDKENFIEECRALFKTGNEEKTFYQLRDEFNKPGTDRRRRAAIFVYLNRHCFNGLCRYNSSGEFNVPFGRYKKPYFPDAELHSFVERSQNATFTVGDFRDAMDQAKKGDVVYCDPPYAPLSLTSSFSDYSADGFSAQDQKDLADKARELSARGVTVVLSNHDTPFVREIYQGAKIQELNVRRSISAAGGSRKKVGEVIATFSPTSS